MKKRVLCVAGLIGAIAASVSTLSIAGNPAFPPVDERQMEAQAQPTRFFVKYHKGKEQQTRQLLQTLDLAVVDILDNQQVLVVSGSQEQVDKLTDGELIDYVEPEPVRSLFSQ